jgi:hypothetical protein
MTTTRAGRVIGALFLSAFVLYGGGEFLVASTTDNATPLPQNAASLGLLSAGATLLLLNSLAVATIGTVAFHVLRRRHHRIAAIYLVTRSVEAGLLALAPLGTLMLALLARGSVEAPNARDSGLQGLARAAVENGQTAYWLAMATLGVGSVFFCWALMRSDLLPRFLAAWGMVGYAIFAVGSVLELGGYEVGLILAAPGGLFEVAAGCYLLARGFKAAGPDSPADSVPTPSRLQDQPRLSPCGSARRSPGGRVIWMTSGKALDPMRDNVA